VRSSPKKPACPIQKECGVCPHVNQDYGISLSKKHDRELKLFQRAGLLESAQIYRPIPSPRKLGYRTVFKLAVRKEPQLKSKKRFRLGLFQPGSHRIGPDLTDCPLHSAPLRKLLKIVSALLEETELSPYDEENQTGDLKYLIGRTNQDGSSLMITWVVTRAVPEILKRLTQAIQNKGIPLKVSAMNLHPEPSNSIWGAETVLLSADNHIVENLARLRFKLGVGSFFQVNPWQAENIYLRIGKIAQETREKDLAWDLYSGVGTISCVLGRFFSKVVSFEENAEGAQLINVNAQINDFGDRIVVREGLAEVQARKELSDPAIPNLIVANPSRRGIQEKAREVLLSFFEKSSSTQLVYLSCNIETLVRDLNHFKMNQVLPIELQAFDMHAQTGQLEWLVRLQKVSQ